jgi:hypothetical protein
VKNVPSELNKYATNMYKELQRSDDSIFCVAPLDFFRTWQNKISYVMNENF